MDFFSKIGFAGTYFSYKDAGLIHLDPTTGTKIIQTSDTAIIVSTHLRCLDTDNNYFQTMQPDNGKNASPALFAYALPNAFLGEASIFLKTTGQCFAINEDTLDGITLLKMTFDILDSGESKNVICGICDTNVPTFLRDILKNENENFSGSLFFTISKKERQLNYGKIEAGNNDTILFNGIRIENLVQLGQVCIKNYKNKG
jgi:hypothetical protein